MGKYQKQLSRSSRDYQYDIRLSSVKQNLLDFLVHSQLTQKELEKAKWFMMFKALQDTFRHKKACSHLTHCYHNDECSFPMVDWLLLELNGMSLK
jgi:hypothetical protein